MLEKGFYTHNAAICGRSLLAIFVRFFAQKVTINGDPQDGLVSFDFLAYHNV
tara:strand:- start:1833 stop:1988 length:156 start_codon:yes stop_codon:yes gene_type:complete